MKPTSSAGSVRILKRRPFIDIDIPQPRAAFFECSLSDTVILFGPTGQLLLRAYGNGAQSQRITEDERRRSEIGDENEMPNPSLSRGQECGSPSSDVVVRVCWLRKHFFFLFTRQKVLSSIACRRTCIVVGVHGVAACVSWERALVRQEMRVCIARCGA